MKVNDKLSIADGASPKAIAAAEYLRRAIGTKLAQIADLLRPGYKLTIICRHPDNPDNCDIVLTDEENYDEVLACLERSKTRDKTP